MNCALRYELDDLGKVGITLEVFNSLEAMDLFMQKFCDSNDVKEAFLDKINKFLKTDRAREFLNLIKERENNGYIKGYAYDATRSYHIPLIYQSSILNEKDIYIRLRQNLLKRSVLYDIYYRKWYILPKNPSRFLRDELAHCVVHNGTSRIFIKEFINYIKRLNKEERYFVFRVLCDKCNLLDVPKKKNNNLYKIRFDNLSNIGKEYKLVRVQHYAVGDFSEEELSDNKNDTVSLRDGVSEEFCIKDISLMLENYDIDEIDRNTDYFDKLEKKRGK